VKRSIFVVQKRFKNTMVASTGGVSGRRTRVPEDIWSFFDTL
jgi:hypothetical protein